jgi:hypothetical protein
LARFIALNGTHGVLLTIGGTTMPKCLPNLENPAPTQTTTISSLSATIMSTAPYSAKKTIAGRYCSPRAWRKDTLSRMPSVISATARITISTGETRPPSNPSDVRSLSPTEGSTSDSTSVARIATYRPTSNGVRRSPAVSGTLPGHGGSRIVSTRPYVRQPPVNGLK